MPINMLKHFATHLQSIMTLCLHPKQLSFGLPIVLSFLAYVLSFLAYFPMLLAWVGPRLDKKSRQCEQLDAENKRLQAEHR